MTTYKKKLLSEAPNGQGVVVDQQAPIGDLDTTFDPNATGTVFALAQQSDGKILLGGSFTSVAATTRNRIARLHENGALDTTFDPSASATVLSVLVEPSGKILLGGGFTSVSATPRNRIARLHENGDLDTTFNADVNAFMFVSVNSVAQQPDGKVVLGGLFESVNQTTRNLIARLNSSSVSKVLHNTSENVESVEIFVASTSDSPAERQVIIYADGDRFGYVKVNDNSGAKKVFSIPPTFGAGVEITANRTSFGYTPTLFGHVNVQEDEE